jgi:hypothetical protein|tara:strand:- start:3 stop:974 length:972 start_codon:yes stop_codon:yes gene_type:complete
MAIFRAGKRIGPFDIRGGISRGDYKSSAYHKTDKDPRFKQRGNTDNTIGRFRAAMNQGEGFARPSRYAIRLFPPSMLEGAIAAQNSSVDRGGSKFIPLHDYHEKSKQLTSLNNTIGRQVNIMCDTVNMPGVDLQTQEIQYGSEPNYNQVTSHGFAGNIVATFYADKYLRERQFFEHWQKLVVDTISHKANYYDNYVGKMHIYQLAADSEVNRDMPTYAVEAIDVFPEKIGALDYGHALGNQIQKITIEFSYKQWFNMGLESANGLEFGQSQQSAAVIKARERGLFGKLPIEIQRAGKDIFQQGRTVFNPIGRIFKGKVFPPFT